MRVCRNRFNFRTCFFASSRSRTTGAGCNGPIPFGGNSCWSTQEFTFYSQDPVRRITMARRDTRAGPPAFQPPNMSALGGLHFTLEDRELLSAWLGEDGWPRGTMDIAMLEGYL